MSADGKHKGKVREKEALQQETWWGFSLSDMSELALKHRGTFQWRRVLIYNAHVQDTKVFQGHS